MKITFEKNRNRYRLHFKHEGKYVRKFFNAKSEANDWYEDYIQKGKVLTSKTTLTDYINKYLELNKSYLAPSTYRGWVTRLGYWKDAMGHEAINEVTPYKVKLGFRKFTEGKGYKPNTLKNMLIPLSAVFSEAVEDDLIDFNPVMQLKKKKLIGKEMKEAKVQKVKRTMDYNQIKILKEQIDADFANGYLGDLVANQNKAFFYLAIHTGMRRGEIAGLEFKDINFDKSTIHISKSVDNPNSHTVHVKTTKSGKDRTIDFDSELGKVLTTYVSWLKRWNMANGVRSSFLFTNPRTLQPYCKDFSNRFKNCTKRAGLGAWGIHEMRHTHASFLIANTSVPIKYISDRLGHSTIQITLDLYGHLVPSESKTIMAEALNLINQKTS